MFSQLCRKYMRVACVGAAALFTLCLTLTPTAHAEVAVPQSTEQVRLSFSPLVKKTSPAVVNIYAKVKVRERVINPLMSDPFFNHFFGLQGFGGVQERVANSLGSGVIVDAADGLVATNTHVVKNAVEIVAVTAEGQELPAKKILEDAKTDLAILKVDTKGKTLQALTVADSDMVEVGDMVMAIGNPFGVGQTVTTGIVSALARTGVGGDYSSFIQTDAAINPGNSGGALVDMQGRLIGINSMIFSKDGGSLGIGFAIPSNMLRTIIEASKQGGKLVRPWTGVTGQAVTPDMIDSLRLKKAQGALINTVNAKGPAARVGIKPGDVIIAVDGREVRDPQDLKFRLATVGINKDVTLTVSRNGENMAVKMRTEAPPEDPPRQETTVKGDNPFAGATIVNISPAVIEEMGDLTNEKGVVISAMAGGIAASVGLQPGDIILAINKKQVNSVADVLAEVQGKRLQRWVLQILRGRQVLTLAVQG